jgi:hypothetical protein
MFWNREGAILWLQNLYKGQSVFLCLGGPSFGKLDHSQLNRPGVITFGVNNMPVTFRPMMWSEVDHPCNFIGSIWRDPRIQKFCPRPKCKRPIFDNNEWQVSKDKVGSCSNIIYWERSEDRFDHNVYLDEPRINWGCSKDQTCTAGHRGGRSVMLATVKILYLLGFRTVFLLGCDFSMTLGGKNYHFEQDRSKGAVKNNTNTYAALRDRFTLLRPIFEKRGFHIFNCNPDSGLQVFDHIPFEEAVEHAAKPLKAEAEWIGTHWRTIEQLRGTITHKGITKECGMYDRQRAIKDAKKEYEKAKKKAGRASTDAQRPPSEVCPVSLSLEELRKNVLGGRGGEK